MKLSDLIIKIRTTCPIFKNRVGGSSDLAKLRKSSNLNQTLATPHAFCIPMDTEYKVVAEGQDAKWEVTEFFSILICITHSGQRVTGDAVFADDQLDAIRWQLVDGIGNWSPNNWMRNVQFVKDEHVDIDATLLWHVFVVMVMYSVMPNSVCEDEEWDEFGGLQTIHTKSTVVARVHDLKEPPPSPLPAISIERVPASYPDPSEETLERERAERDQHDVSDQQGLPDPDKPTETVKKPPEQEISEFYHGEEQISKTEEDE